EVYVLIGSAVHPLRSDQPRRVTLSTHTQTDTHSGQTSPEELHFPHTHTQTHTHSGQTSPEELHFPHHTPHYRHKHTTHHTTDTSTHHTPHHKHKHTPRHRHK